MWTWSFKKIIHGGVPQNGLLEPDIFGISKPYTGADGLVN